MQVQLQIRGKALAPDKTREFEEISRKEPLVQKTLEIFGGQIVDIISKPTAGGK